MKKREEWEFKIKTDAYHNSCDKHHGFICVVMQAYIEGYFWDGKGKSAKVVK